MTGWSKIVYLQMLLFEKTFNLKAVYHWRDLNKTTRCRQCSLNHLYPKSCGDSFKLNDNRLLVEFWSMEFFVFPLRVCWPTRLISSALKSSERKAVRVRTSLRLFSGIWSNFVPISSKGTGFSANCSLS